MRIFKIVICVVACLLGVFFLTKAVSDIQIGFGLVLIVQGLLGLPTVQKTQQ